MVVLLAVTLAAGLASALGGTGCADTDPRYGLPQVVQGRQVDFGIDAAESTPAALGDAAPSTKTAPQLFADLFATLTDPAKGSTCLPCHGTTQVPVFMADTAEATRAKFKAAGYDKLATSRFYLKGQHTGNALKPEQKTLTQQWAAAEAAGGGGTPGPGDAGDGG